VNSHFANPTAYCFAVTKITELSGIESGKDTGFCFAVAQFAQPLRERVSLPELVH
jgi:hypothetical protein